MAGIALRSKLGHNWLTTKKKQRCLPTRTMNIPRCNTLRLIVCTAVLMAMTEISHAATTFLWNVPTPAANNWNVNANWTPNTGNPGAADSAIFGNVGPSTSPTTVNNVVSVSTSVNTL